MGIPNGEVRKCLSGYLLEELVVQMDEEAILKESMYSLESGNLGQFFESIRKFFEKLYPNIRSEEMPSVREHILQDFFELYMGDLIKKQRNLANIILIHTEMLEQPKEKWVTSSF